MKILEYYSKMGGGQVTKDEPRINNVHSLIPRSGAKILDIGCHDGYISKKFKKEGNIVIGSDIQKGALGVAKQKIDLAILNNLEENWPFKANSFDYIHMGAVIEHVFDYHHLFNETNRVLKKGGRLIIGVPNFGHYAHRIQVMRGKMPWWYKNFEHIRLWTRDWLKIQLSHHGFEESKFIGCAFRDTLDCRIASYLFPSLMPLFVMELVKLRNESVSKQ